jgi:hypothetical protein
VVALDEREVGCGAAKRVIDGVNAELTESYVDAALARQMEEAVAAHEKEASITRLLTVTHLPRG